MKKLKFGLFAPQVGAPFAAIKERALLADRLGYDSIWFVDHMWSRGMPDLDHLEAWTVMSAVALGSKKARMRNLLIFISSIRNFKV